MKYALSGLAATAAAVSHANRATCDESSLNTTTTTYTTTSEDTIFTVAKKFDCGPCDIARYNRMIDAEHMFANFTPRIPPQQNATATCLKGGPHDYKTIAGDTIEEIALYKLKMTVKSVYENGKMAVSSIHEELPANTFLKIPQCVSSVCHVTPFHFTYGVYKDLAEKFGTTVGQIMAFNGGYNYSESAADADADAAWISVPMGCINLALNVTEEI
ncbi:hypothetical protein N7516_003438 [Penicillium verrucosum]|uniref:uncharacterized protein n=1 Tax=Penicillium verrucosum TaxID=60171 RepID=UPI002545359D|nr:uncharacterized protein N7516_003438 [Penicillium verrucosum]KAJ5943270.1 hypothetical protein N7516_003438 [Penicillium verrucosum]